MRRGIRTLALLVALGSAMVGAPVLAVDEFPAGDERYHTFTEMRQVLQETAAAHPDITRLTDIGTSFAGRKLWLLRITDQPDVDEPNEPEVLVTGLTHAREHLTVEQALALIRWLTDGYGSDQQVTNLVDHRVIWVIPMLNPDGGEWDIRYGKYHRWRKNRQPTPGSAAVGTDLNRNYGYRWDCCGGSSDSPRSLLYHGPAPWSAPETSQERDFIKSRRIAGTQRIELILNLHTAGEKILFPYGYTTRAYPPDMIRRDRRAMKALANGIAARNGYSVTQAARWYITDGTANDWAYGAQRILSLTMELYPSGDPPFDRFYPPDEKIGPQTRRNRGALLWYLVQAACPYAAAGLQDPCTASSESSPSGAAAAASALPSSARAPRSLAAHALVAE
jgi:murein tripeptide amidase MpaA